MQYINMSRIGLNIERQHFFNIQILMISWSCASRGLFYNFLMNSKVVSGTNTYLSSFFYIFMTLQFFCFKPVINLFSLKRGGIKTIFYPSLFFYIFMTLQSTKKNKKCSPNWTSSILLPVPVNFKIIYEVFMIKW